MQQLSHGWRFVSPCGDFELRQEGADTFRVTGKDLTSAEARAVRIFETAARERIAKGDWILDAGTAVTEGIGENAPILNYDFSFAAPGATYAQVAALFGKQTTGTTGVITAIRSTGGTVRVSSEAVNEVVLKDGDELAVTLPRPTLCCPVPIPGPIDQRATWVLRAFLSTEQKETWDRWAYVLVRGSHSGHTYRVAHRHSTTAIQQGKCAWDVSADHVMHAHATWLPPAEEVLCLMLTLQYREPWIRNLSGNLTGTEPHYPNPFMAPGHTQFHDGVDSAMAVSSAYGTLAAYNTMAGQVLRLGVLS